MNSRKTRWTRILGAAVLLAAAPMVASAQERSDVSRTDEDPQIAAARERYDADSWPEGVRRAGLQLGRVELADHEGTAVVPGPGPMVVRRFEGLGGRSAVCVELEVHDTPAQAHRRLLETVAFVSSLKLLPTTRQEGIDAGDVGYVGYSGAAPGREAWIAFVEGNLWLRVLCLDPRLTPATDLGAIAEKLAGAARSLPVLPRGSDVPRPVVQVFQGERPACRAGESIALDVVTLDAMGDRESLHWSVHGPGQGYVERGADGRLHLVATGGGQLTLELTVLGSNGTRAIDRRTFLVEQR